MFAGPNYSAGLLAGQTIAMLALNGGPIAIGLAAGTPAGWIPLAVQAACVVAAAASAARRMAINPLVLAALHPLSYTLLTVAVWNSALRTLWQGGVRWRGTFYPLADLRRGLVRPGDGRRRIPGGSPPGA
jgi:hypothetical protein